MKKNGKLIEVGMFARIQNSKYVDHGIKKGDLVYVAGNSQMPVSEDDPYLNRLYFIASFMDSDGYVLADEKKPFLIDGLELKPVTKPLQEKLQDKLVEKFTPPQEEGADEVLD